MELSISQPPKIFFLIECGCILILWPAARAYQTNQRSAGTRRPLALERDDSGGTQLRQGLTLGQALRRMTADSAEGASSRDGKSAAAPPPTPTTSRDAAKQRRSSISGNRGKRASSAGSTGSARSSASDKPDLGTIMENDVTRELLVQHLQMEFNMESYLFMAACDRIKEEYVGLLRGGALDDRQRRPDTLPPRNPASRRRRHGHTHHSLSTR